MKLIVLISTLLLSVTSLAVNLSDPALSEFKGNPNGVEAGAGAYAADCPNGTCIGNGVQVQLRQPVEVLKNLNGNNGISVKPNVNAVGTDGG